MQMFSACLVISSGKDSSLTDSNKEKAKLSFCIASVLEICTLPPHHELGGAGYSRDSHVPQYIPAPALQGSSAAQES